ncbi:MAG TPA: hydrogenase expression/formation protein HypE [Chromatiales bacterium]|nr:hydrogenase expression/formation protein HypE [Chromatiales bacterium]
MADRFIELAHGNGGRLTRELIDGLFVRHLKNPQLDTQVDAAAVDLAFDGGNILVTTDGFTVQPLEYPGGNIGSLAVHGTVNDLAVAGAEPKALTVNALIEEGLEITLLERLVASMGDAARACGVSIVAGDTKVLRRGEGGGVYFCTTGLGIRPAGLEPGLHRISPGDRVLVSGPVGNHGTAVLLAREEFGLYGDLVSDEASVLPFTRALLDLNGLKFMRDPTRGGLATVMHEIVDATGLGLRLREGDIPLCDEVRSVCALLGYEPWYLACEGRVVAVVSPEDAGEALARWRSVPGGEHAQLIGELRESPSSVILETAIGGERFLEELEDDPLPRIC